MMFVHCPLLTQVRCWHTALVAASLAPLPNLDLLDAAGLKALILSQHDELLAAQQRLFSRESEIEHLKLLIAKLRRMQFGRKSEKLERQLEQLETAKVSPASEPASKFSAQASSLVKPARQPLPEHLPREVKTYSPQEQVCACGGRLRPLGQDVSEVLEYVPARFKVMPMPDFIIFMRADRFRKRPAGPTYGASSTTCRWRTLHPWPPRR